MIYCARISVASEVMTGAVWLLLALKAGLKTFRRNLSAAACMDYTSPATSHTMVIWATHLNKKSHYEENLSVATYMNYTRLFQQLPDNSPLFGAQTFVQLLAKCNPYTPQR